MTHWGTIVEKAVIAAGYQFWGCVESSEPGGLVLRVSIESEDGSGIEIGDCVKAHKQIGACLDVEGVSRDAYRLEVSSPGMERQFFRIEQCKPYIGQSVHCRLKVPVDGRRKITGVMSEASAGVIGIEEGESVHQIDWDHISKIHLKVEVFT